MDPYPLLHIITMLQYHAMPSNKGIESPLASEFGVHWAGLTHHSMGKMTYDTIMKHRQMVVKTMVPSWYPKLAALCMVIPPFTC